VKTEALSGASLDSLADVFMPLHETIRQAIAEVLPMKQLRDIRKHVNMLLDLACGN
jgi:hypothetical protein